MKVAVWDTYVPLENGKIMHFDIIAPDDVKDENVIYGYGKEYLRQKNKGNLQLTARECRLCHIEQASEAMIEEIHQEGYYIFEMQNCNE